MLKVSIAVKKHHDHDNSSKEKHLIGASLQFQMSSPLSQWDMQADMVLAKKLGVLHLDLQATGSDCVTLSMV